MLKTGTNSESGSVVVEFATTFIILFTFLALLVVTMLAIIIKDILDYVTIETAQCIKFGEKNTTICLENVADGFDFFIDANEISASEKYYQNLATYKQATSSHAKDALLVLTLSYDVITDLQLVSRVFPHNLSLTSTATARIEQ